MSQTKCMTFQIKNKKYYIPILEVAEVIAYPKKSAIRSIPLSDKDVIGITIVRDGNVIIKKIEDDEFSTILRLNNHIGLAVKSADKIISVKNEDLLSEFTVIGDETYFRLQSNLYL